MQNYSKLPKSQAIQPMASELADTERIAAGEGNDGKTIGKP